MEANKNKQQQKACPYLLNKLWETSSLLYCILGSSVSCVDTSISLMLSGVQSLILKVKVPFVCVCVQMFWQVLHLLHFVDWMLLAIWKIRKIEHEIWLLMLQLYLLLYFTIHSFFHRHFLFKTGTGTTPLFSTATPGYTMASGSVYSPPTRPLPRNTLSRSAFKFKKSSKYCSWKCTALCAVGVSVLLAILLSYFIGESHFL